MLIEHLKLLISIYFFFIIYQEHICLNSQDLNGMVLNMNIEIEIIKDFKKWEKEVQDYFLNKKDVFKD